MRSFFKLIAIVIVFKVLKCAGFCFLIYIEKLQETN
ncbi:hypothetical protein SCB49_14575 [unidentified eubacterium SCB49]|nr:hypothetical protein SCB49_14575 [unidentified eubacterium SCB49]